VVLVNFWATWCRPCVAEVPNLKECYDRYHAKGFDIVGISSDHRRADLEDFVKAREIPWPTVYGNDKPSETIAFYGVHRFPTMILVGKDGKVVSLDVHGQELQEELAKLLGPADEGKNAKKPAKPAKTG